MPPTSLVVIGASAGGLQALQRALPTLSHDLRAAVAIVVHRMPVEHRDRLPRLLQKVTSLPVAAVHGDERIEIGRVYVAPAGVHLAVHGDVFKLTAGPRENGSRPAIDVLFRSAATARGRKVVGVLLSGMLDDGTAGLAAIKAAGGYTIAQEPGDAIYADMPRNAIANVAIDAVCRATEMGACIEAALDTIAVPLGGRHGTTIDKPSSFSCPDCNGVLWETDENGTLHYRCRTGHAFSPSALYKRQDDELEAALWSAVRALEERAQMSEVLAARLRERGLQHAAQRLERQAKAVRERAGTVRETVTDLLVRREAAEVNEAGTGS